MASNILRTSNLAKPRSLLLASQRWQPLAYPLNSPGSTTLPPILSITNLTFNEQNRDFNSKGYRNFGHARADKPSSFRKIWLSIILIGMYSLVIDYAGIFRYLRGQVTDVAGKILPKVEAKALHKEPEDGGQVDGASVESDGPESGSGKGKKKAGFRDRKIIEYENRIRQYSTPDKVFRYFASRKVQHPNGDMEVFMTPDDFLRSLTPGMKQPEGLGLDKFETVDLKRVDSFREEFGLTEDSIFNKLGRYGLISFSDYIFLLTVLSTSRRHFEIAFRMFDLNGDGDVDSEEFQKVADLCRQQTSVGLRHRDHANTGSTFKGVNTALTKYFFGTNGEQKLTIDKFLDFQEQLQKEILTLEFNRKAGEDGTISEVDFAEMLLIYANYPDKFKQRVKKRIRKMFKGNSEGISQKDYLNLFHFLSNINDVDTALTFYHVAGAAIDPATMKHVARIVANADLSDHLIDVVFAVFDANQDGQLSNREFVAVMKNRVLRGLEKPKDTGFLKFLNSVAKCARECKPAVLDF